MATLLIADDENAERDHVARMIGRNVYEVDVKQVEAQAACAEVEPSQFDSIALDVEFQIDPK